jgi:hypothetical protein
MELSIWISWMLLPERLQRYQVDWMVFHRKLRSCSRDALGDLQTVGWIAAGFPVGFGDGVVGATLNSMKS